MSYFTPLAVCLMHVNHLLVICICFRVIAFCDAKSAITEKLWVHHLVFLPRNKHLTCFCLPVGATETIPKIEVDILSHYINVKAVEIDFSVEWTSLAIAMKSCPQVANTTRRKRSLEMTWFLSDWATAKTTTEGNIYKYPFSNSRP